MDVPALIDDDMDAEDVVVEGMGWDDDDDDIDAENQDFLLGPVQCLFCAKILNSANEVFSHCLSDHSFNLHALCGCWALDCVGYIKLINYIRTQHPAADTLRGLSPGGGPAPWGDDKFMRPSDPEDLLLQYDIESADCSAGKASEAPGSTGASVCTTPDRSDMQPEQVQAYLVQRLQEAESRAGALEANLERAVGDLGRMREKMQGLVLAGGVSSDGLSNENFEDADLCSSAVGAVQRLTLKEDEAYFSSYADFNIHAEMLQDKVRSESYRDFIMGNPEVFKDKIVLDIGCGTGILSMFAAKAGAKHVIGVDMSEIIYRAMDIARENGLETKITFLRGRMEDVKLPHDKVDVIISEWMGYFLLFESMLDTVIVARNHHLAPGGHVYPDKCSMWLAGFSDHDLRAKFFDFWDDVYGFKMSCMKTEVVNQTAVAVTAQDKIVTQPALLKEMDVHTCSLSDVDFTSTFTLTASKDAELHGLVGYFDIGFEAGCSKQIVFSTGPDSTSTHWKQTQFLLKTPINITKGSSLSGSITVKKAKQDPRSLDITITLDGKTQEYFMD